MPTSIVTTHYRYKRPPRKKKPVLLEVPAIVTPKPKAAPAIVQQDVKPGNDNRTAGPKARIVQATKPKRRRKVWADDGQHETEPEIKALIGRMMLGRGPSNST
jgi:hypothetical protein